MITIYTKDNCSYCTQAKAFLRTRVLAFEEKKIGTDVTREWIIETYPIMKTAPIIVDDHYGLIGGYEQLKDFAPLYLETNNGPNTGNP